MIGPNVTSALERAGLAPASTETRELISFGLVRIGGGDDDVLEITRALWRTETHGGESVVILTRELLCIVIAPVATGLLRRKSAPACVQISHSAVQDLIDSDEDGSGIFFIGAGDNPSFLLHFARTAERDRFYPCVFATHRGEFSRWGLQLDPDDYVADFDRFSAEILSSGIDDSSQLRAWVAERYGDFRIDSALGLALEWRDRELSDIARPAGLSMRAALIGSPSPWGEVPQSRRVIVRLGEQLYDAGLLGPPYDERSYDTGEPLVALDAGPARLLAVMSLAGYAHGLRDPRAREFIDAALPHLNSVPADVFRARIRELWADIAPLPDPDVPREFPIWEDPAVREICTFEGTRVVYRTDALAAADQQRVAAFLSALASAEDASADAYVARALAGVEAYEEMSPMSPDGWRKFVVYQVSELAHGLWRRFGLVHETAMLAQWVVVTIGARDWGPDGNSTPLGQHHSYAMHLAGETGVGVIVIDPESGLASAPTGNEARHAARKGSF